MGAGERIWRERSADPAAIAALREKGLSALEAKLLASRGIAPDSLEEFRDPSVKRLARPELLPGIGEAVRTIAPFVRDGRRIVVFGDYDADGVCASAILVSVLRSLGANAGAFIPERLGEGYGMTEASLSRMHREHPGVALVVTVDNGITAAPEIAMLKAQGVAVVVTDHHLPPDPAAGGMLPEADAIVDPKVASCPGCEDLSGAGVAFFLANALTAELRDEAVRKGLLREGAKLAGPMLVMAGLATVADLMPLSGQNRIIVASALAAFARHAPLGLKELFLRAARRTGTVDSRDFGFMLAPRLNAAGRMASARMSYELLMAQDREEARRLAFGIDAHNAARKTEEKRMDCEARAQIPPSGAEGALVVADSKCPDGGGKWHPGVAGIVAARLMESEGLPVAVVVDGRGSVRAPDGCNVRAALDAASSALVRYGGHAAAGGFTLKPGALDGFADLFRAACAKCAADIAAASATPFDAWLEPGEVTMELLEATGRMEPFGEGNPEPVFGIRGAVMTEARSVGAEGKHAVFSFEGPAKEPLPRAVWWGHGKDAVELHPKLPYRCDLLFRLEKSSYGAGDPHVELRLEDIRPESSGVYAPR